MRAHERSSAWRSGGAWSAGADPGACCKGADPAHPLSQEALLLVRSCFQTIARSARAPRQQSTHGPSCASCTRSAELSASYNAVAGALWCKQLPPRSKFSTISSSAARRSPCRRAHLNKACVHVHTQPAGGFQAPPPVAWNTHRDGHVKACKFLQRRGSKSHGVAAKARIQDRTKLPSVVTSPIAYSKYQRSTPGAASC